MKRESGLFRCSTTAGTVSPLLKDRLSSCYIGRVVWPEANLAPHCDTFATAREARKWAGWEVYGGSSVFCLGSRVAPCTNGASCNYQQRRKQRDEKQNLE